MYFLGSTIAVIRKAFGRKQTRAEDDVEKYNLSKREFYTIAKLGVFMGNSDFTFKSRNLFKL